MCFLRLALFGTAGGVLLGLGGIFGVLGDLRHLQVVLHGFAGGGCVLGADGAIDFAMHFGGVLKVVGVFDGLAAAVVERSGDGFHECGQDGIAGGLGDGAMEADVVDEIFRGVVDGGVELGYLLGQRGEVLALAALGGQRGEVAFEQHARFEHVPGLKAVQGADEPHRRLTEIGRSIGDKGSDAMANLHDTHGGKVADAGAERGAADLEAARELALGRDFVARLQFSALDHLTNVVDHLRGEIIVSRRWNLIRHEVRKSWDCNVPHNEISTAAVFRGGETL